LERALGLLSESNLGSFMTDGKPNTALVQNETADLNLITILCRALGRDYGEYTLSDLEEPALVVSHRVLQGYLRAISGDVDTAEKDLRETVRAEVSGETQTPTWLQLQTLLAYCRVSYCRTRGITGSAELARQALSVAEETFSSTKEIDPASRARLLQCIAAQRIYSGDVIEGIEKLSQACDLLANVPSRIFQFEVECLTDLARAYFLNRDYDHARLYGRRAVDVETKGDNDKLRLARAFALCGMIEFVSAPANCGLAYFENANSFYMEFPGKHIQEHLNLLRHMEQLLPKARRNEGLARIKSLIASLITEMAQ
jgi:tetratricopeptide (TPR) repeat protein